MVEILESWEDSGLCTGCRACVLICSFHHLGYFAPAKASLQVQRNNANGSITVYVYDNCDLCSSEESPRCLEYCPRECLSLNQSGYPSKPQRLA